MRKKITIISLLLASSFLFAGKALAICPVCVVAVAAGVGLSRYLGVDDVLTGIWIGGLLLSISLWTIDWLVIKKWNFKFYKIVTILAYYLMVVVPMSYSEIIGHPFNKIWGMDKLIFGILLGTIALYLGNILYKFLKKKNNDRAHFPFEKVAIPVSFLVILNIIFYFVTKA
ncbi:MAG: hypothetical protein WCK37_03400 [Candidatus Falkowbacteria bacterium]